MKRLTDIIASAFFVVGLWTCVFAVCAFYVNAQTEPTPIIYEPQPTDTFRLGPCVSLFNGESGTITGQYYALTEAAAHTGGYGFISTGTGYLVPRIKHNTINLTQFDEVWLWMRATQKECDVQITGRSYKGDTQTKTQHLTAEWQLVRLVVTDLDAGNGTLPVLNEWILKPVVADGILPQFQVDDVWAVKLLPPAEEPIPDPVDPGDTDPEPDPGAPAVVVYGGLVPMGGTAVYDQAGEDGSVRRWTYTITVSAPVITTIPPPSPAEPIAITTTDDNGTSNP